MGKVKQFFKDFGKFISRGNVVDMAIGVIVASAFTAIVTALTNGIIMPCVNALIALIGGEGIESAYTILVAAPTYDSTGAIVYDEAGKVVVDLANSIYIDWGAFISAILNFLIIAFVLFTVLRVVMNSQNALKKARSEYPTRAERKVLKAEGKVDMKDTKALIEATKELRERNKPAPAPVKPTQEELLTQILAELQKQNTATNPALAEAIEGAEKADKKEKDEK